MNKTEYETSYRKQLATDDGGLAMKVLLILGLLIGSALAANAADIVIDAGDLGTITVPDRVDADGFDVQVTLQAWLDEVYDPENAGGPYLQRIRMAFKEIGTKGVKAQYREYKHSKTVNAALDAAAGYTGDDVAE